MTSHARLLAAALALAILAVAPRAGAEGDAAAGEKVFRQCKACHTVEPGKNRVGPSLAGLFGRKAGSVEDFKGYSDGLKASGIVWDEARLDPYLENPKAVIADSKMVFAGIPSAADRANLIAYLKGATK